MGLPISPAQAELLAAAGEQAPHGRGEATVVDTSVRDAQRIQSAQIAFGNPEWGPLVERLAQAAKKGLGVTRGVKAELHNLLVYSQGGHFARHRDSEKTPGMFGTLVVSLPCAHRGGDLVLRHNGKQERFETASEAPAQITWCAFYADVEHELTPLESGHRVVLVYNLVGLDGVPTAPPTVSAGALALREAASNWGAGCLKAAHMLEHKYSEQSLLRWEHLKGKDAAVVNALRKSGAYDLQLVSVTFTEEGDDGGDEDYGYGRYGSPEITDCEYSFRGWRMDDEATDLPAPIAAVYRGETEIDPELFLQRDFFEGRDPDDEEHEGPTGNEGCPMSRWYYAAAVVIRPKKLRFAAAGRERCARLVRGALEGDADALCGFGSPQALYDACLGEKGGVASFRPHIVNEFLMALGHPGLSEESAQSFLRSMKGPHLSAHMAPGLGAVLAKFGEESGSKWVGAELQRLLAEAAGCTEEQAATAFDLLSKLFSSTGSEASWRERMHHEAAEALVASLGSGVSHPVVNVGSKNDRTIVEIHQSRVAQQASKTITAAVSSLMSPSEKSETPASPVFRNLCRRAGTLVALNPARFDPLRAVPSALVSLGFPSSSPTLDEQQQQPQTSTSAAAAATVPPGPNRSARDTCVSTLLDAVVAHVAADKARHDCGAETVRFALMCAIEAKAVDQWAPLSSHFAAKLFPPPLQPSQHRRPPTAGQSQAPHGPNASRTSPRPSSNPRSPSSYPTTIGTETRSSSSLTTTRRASSSCLIWHPPLTTQHPVMLGAITTRRPVSWLGSCTNGR